jgi:3-hydroxymyristoyl/3-hydroxydecanoyl-(acyl carrier protein) dehydratase
VGTLEELRIENGEWRIFNSQLFKNMNINLDDINIHALLPQRPPFIMVDKLTNYDTVSAKTVFAIREDNLFCKDGVMEEAGLVENIAQTCATRTGFKQFLEISGSGKSTPVVDDRTEQNGEKSGQNECIVGHSEDVSEQSKIKIGVIAMIHSLEMRRCPLVGEVLETSMAIEEEFFTTTLVRSEVKIGDETIATCRMKLFLTDKTPD